MQKYNTQQGLIKLPEYGRHVQNLIEYCKTIPDRDKRLRFAATIVDIMADVYPEIGKGEEAMHTLWDHLAMIADYELDIDYPFPVERRDADFHPQPLPPAQTQIRYRMYGSIIENMIRKATTLPTPEERISLFEYCANQVKRNYHLTNADADEDDNKIISDMIEYAGEQYAEEIYQVFLYSQDELSDNLQYDATKLAEATKKKKKKKKKK